MGKKKYPRSIYFVLFRRSDGSIIHGSVNVVAKSGTTLFLERKEETRRRCGVAEGEFGIVDVGCFNEPIVFASSDREAFLAMREFLENEERTSRAGIVAMHELQK